MSKKLFILLLALILLSIGLVYGMMSRSHVIGSIATIKTVDVGVYEDINCTTLVTTIDWGMVEPGESMNYSAFIRNEANVPITLALTTENWNPADASTWITLTWNYTGETLLVNEVIDVTLTLTVDAEITEISTFSFDIIITGSG